MEEVKPATPLFSLGSLEHDLNLKNSVGPAVILLSVWFGFSVLLILIKASAYK